MSLPIIHRTPPALGAPITEWTRTALERLQHDVDYYTEIVYERCSLQSRRYNADQIEYLAGKLELAASIIRERASSLREATHEHA